MIKSFNQYFAEAQKVTNLTVWHGSNAVFKQFEQSKSRIPNDFFGGGVAYFTENKKVGIQYAKGMAKKDQTPILYECKLTMKKVFDVDDVFTGKELVAFVEKIGVDQFARNAKMMTLGSNVNRTKRELKTGDIELTGEQVFKGLSGTTMTAKAREIIKSFGYDGLRYNGGVNMNVQQKHDVYLPYNASAIKIVKRYKVNVK